MSYWQEDLDNGQLATLRAALDKAPYRREPLEKLVNTMACLLDAAGRDYLRVSELLGKRGLELQTVEKKLVDAERLGYQKQVELGAAREMIERLQGALNQARSSSCQVSQRNLALEKKLDASQHDLAEAREQLDARNREPWTLEARLGIQQELNWRIACAPGHPAHQGAVMYHSTHGLPADFLCQHFMGYTVPSKDEERTIEAARAARLQGSQNNFAVTLANVADDRNRLKQGLKASAANGLDLAIKLEQAERVAEERLAALARAGDSLEAVLEQMDDATK